MKPLVEHKPTEHLGHPPSPRHSQPVTDPECTVRSGAVRNNNKKQRWRKGRKRERGKRGMKKRNCNKGSAIRVHCSMGNMGNKIDTGT